MAERSVSTKKPLRGPAPRVVATRDIHRGVGPVRVIEAGRRGTVICGLKEGLLAVKWDDDEFCRSMAVATTSLGFIEKDQAHG
jgi:hypothetical protein